MTTDQPTPEWTYSRYRAMLRRNGQNFAIVTPDHATALTEDDARILLETLNRPAPDARLRELTREVFSWEVFPCGHKIEVGSIGEAPVAAFSYKSHAEKFCQTFWPTTGEVRPASDSPQTPTVNAKLVEAQQAVGHISSILRTKHAEGEDVAVNSTSMKSLIRWADRASQALTEAGEPT